MEELLKQFNITKKEAKVYTILLKTGGCTMTELAKNSQIKRSTCQEYIKSLNDKGFIVESKINGKIYYQTEDPDKFSQIINERLFNVDQLIIKLKQKNRTTQKWLVSSLSSETAEKNIKKLLKDKNCQKFGSNKLGGIFNKNQLLLISQNIELPYIEIKSTEIIKLHKHILSKIKTR